MKTACRAVALKPLRLIRSKEIPDLAYKEQAQQRRQLSLFLSSLASQTLMMEQTRTLLDESDAQILRRVEHCAIVLGAGRRGNVFYATAGRAIDVVHKGELVTQHESAKFPLADYLRQGTKGYGGLTKASLLTATSESLLSHSRLSSGAKG
jgi:hypothetical protein